MSEPRRPAPASTRPLERRLRRAGVLLMLGLLVEARHAIRARSAGRLPHLRRRRRPAGAGRDRPLGNTFETHSTKKELRLEICSACHPFFTGKQKLVDTAGRVERFQNATASREPPAPRL